LCNRESSCTREKLGGVAGEVVEGYSRAKGELDETDEAEDVRKVLANNGTCKRGERDEYVL